MWAQDDDAEGHFVWSPKPFKALTPESKPFEGIGT